MVKIPDTFEFGADTDIEPERLMELLKKMYRTLAEAINNKPNIYERATDGQTTDTTLSNGDININTSTQKIEMLVEHTDSTTVVWKQI